MTRRILTALLAAILAVAWLTPTANATPTDTQTANATEIASLLDAHNDFRREVGVAPLALAPALSAINPQPWADHLATEGRIFHNNLAEIAVDGAPYWAENAAASSRSIIIGGMKAYRESPPHYATIINPQYNVVAIGVASGAAGWTYTVSNFYGGKLATMASGPTYTTGAAWLAALGSGVDTFTIPPLDVYTTPGQHTVNGRDWKTACAPYSSTITRCRTEIQSGGRWVFNNLTYLPVPRAWWGTNPLANTGTWTASGRLWRTECDTAVTGRNGCRSYIKTGQKWVFNNMVRFTP